jgi:hypothetical protein
MEGGRGMTRQPNTPARVGAVITVRGQRFEMVRHGHETHHSGVAVMVSVWITRCRECGDHFEAVQIAGRLPKVRDGLCPWHRSAVAHRLERT